MKKIICFFTFLTLFPAFWLNAGVCVHSEGSIDWKAEWIGEQSNGAAVYFKNNARIPTKLRKATAHISAHGIYEAYIDGEKIGNDLLTPGWTSYHKRLQYQEYDVTSMLSRGQHCISAIVSPGWYCSGMNWERPEKKYRYGTDVSLLLQIELEYINGQRDTIATDGGWLMSGGPVTFAGIYDGQTIDMTAGHNWHKAGESHAEDGKVMVPSLSEPVRRRAVLKPVALITTPKGEKVIDFGQNLTGWERFTIKGERGDTIRIRHGEILDKDGNFYNRNMRGAKTTTTCILSGGTDTFEPTHTFYGFRYICVEGVRGELDKDNFEAVHICSDFEDIGTFECSNSTINQLQSNIEWSFRDNFVDIPTDCPQRDERLGWTGDAQVFFRTATFLGDINLFFRKWLADVAADQRADGSIPRVVPDVFPDSKNRVGACGWADCVTFIPWQHYMAYGELSVLEDQWDSMKKWVDYCIAEAKSNNGLMTNASRHFGDWLFYSKNEDFEGKSAVTGKALLAQAYFAESARIVAESARLLGYREEAAYYSKVHEMAVEAFRNEYITPSGTMVSDTQTAYVIGLKFSLVPDHLRSVAAKKLVDNIRRYKNHITTGFLGTPYICEVLTDCGYSDVAYDLLMQETCPSWIYPISKGATTIWERWDAIKKDGTPLNGGMVSYNHYSFGAIGDWLYRSALGLRETSPGWRTIEVRPHAGGGITYMKGATKTPYGRLEAQWWADSTGVITKLYVKIPKGTTAKVVLGDGSCTRTEGEWTLTPADMDRVEVRPLVVKEGYFPDGTKMDKWFNCDHMPDFKKLGRRYIVTDFGVADDSTRLQTKAIQKVIDLCAEDGGGVVVIPRGVFLSGTLNFHQGTHLYLEEGAVLKGSDFIGDYFLGPTRIEGEDCTYFEALIQAKDLNGFHIGGKGTIDGNGWRFHRSFWLRRKWNPDCTNKDEQRPRLIYLDKCRNVTLSGITLRDSPFWTTHIHSCEKVWISGVTVTSVGKPKEDSGPSTDAFDLDVVKDVVIENCHISVNDDAVALKGGKGPWADDFTRNPGNGANANVIIRNCTFGPATHACLTLGSESVYNRNIVMYGCKADCPDGVFFRLKVRRDTPQHFEYVNVYDCSGMSRYFFRIVVWNQFFDLHGRPDQPMSRINDLRVADCDFICTKKSKIKEDKNIFTLERVDIQNNKIKWRN